MTSQQVIDQIKLNNTENVWVLKELHWCSRYIQTLHISKTCFAWSAFSTKVDENQAIYLLAMVWKYDHFEKKIWSHYNLACWKDTFEKKPQLIYTIWFTWRYFLLLYESLRDSNYFSSSSTSFWTCNHYWREKYTHKIVIIKSSVDSQLSKYCNTCKKNSLGKTCSCFGIYLEIHYILNESTQITRTRWS